MARLVVFIRRIAVAIATTLLADACAATRPQTASTLPVRECTVGPTAAAPVDSATIIVTSPVDATRIARPTTWGERFVFELAYDTTRADCAGRPLGKVPYRIADIRGSTFRLDPLGNAARLTIRSASEADARDLIDAGVDLLLTESPALAAYAATRPDVTSIPLPWERTWVFVTALQGGLGLDSSSTVRTGFARDVVRADARVAEGPYWWADIGSCGAAASAPDSRPPSAPGSTRVIYPRDEPIARALAERIVALAGAGATTAGLAPNAFTAALTTGTELAYVLPLPRKPVDRCRAVAELLTAAPWVTRLTRPQDAIAPLIDTRLTAVVRRNRLGLTFLADSTLTVTPARP